VEALGVVRTAEPMRWDRGTIGHDARAEIRLGVNNGVVLSGRLFDVIEPVEAWQLREAEAGLSTFLLHDDPRDHYGRHGVEGTFGGRLGEEVSLHAVMGSERWRSVLARRPFTVLRDLTPWRMNDAMDEGTVDLIGLRLNVDTRERLRSPWTGGWYVKADIERGRGTIARAPKIGDAATPAEEVTYTRGFLDARRYNKIAPGTALNLRLVAGGQLGGDQLPLQRRFSMGGFGALDGYDFRRAPYDVDVFTCGGMTEREGRATQCDRVALTQVELRQNFQIDFVRSDRDDDWWRPGFNGRGSWVIFADAGRGWSVGTGDPAYRTDRGLPPLSSFRTSVGAGVDLGGIGFYLAKATSTSEEKVNFFVRLGRRF
jgi:outer membrane protein assembly factor BamA